MRRALTLAVPILLAGLIPASGRAQRPGAGGPTPAARTVFLDSAGVVRWTDDRQEVALFGANYVLPTASDYRAAGYLHLDRRRMIDEDMAQFARLGWDGLRLTFWGDWESADSAGNLIANDHLDLLDYLVARARERGIYMLFSPIQLYSSNWPDAMERDPATPGFARVFGKGRMGTDPAAIAAQVNYLKQILDHVNPYTGVALKDEPAILFIELVNEPWHHPEDLEGSIAYLNALTDAVRSTGCRKLVFYNVSQDFRIAEAIRRSRVQGVTFAWYPTGLNAGHELAGNYLRAVDAFPDMLRPEMARLPRIVYEFDSPDLRTGFMYPAMARTFRAVGAQFAAMFAYDMLGTASRNLGWQTHYLNLVYTPRKAMSAVIAAEAMRRLPRFRSYGAYPGNTRFGDFHVAYDDNLGELVARDAYLYAGSTSAVPPEPKALRRVAGYGSSPVVTYGGEGIYFLDKVRSGVWRLEVYPDAVPVRDPFEPPNAGKVVTRAISRAWPMTVSLPDLGTTFTVQPITAGNPRIARAASGRFTVTPGVYVLGAAGKVDTASLPAFIGAVGFGEYHAPPPDTVPPSVTSLAPTQVLAGRDAQLLARVVTPVPPDSVTLFLRPDAGFFYRPFPMRPAGGYEYAAAVPAAALREGPWRYVITIFRGDSAITFPSGLALRPNAWNYYATAAWSLDVVTARTPLALFDPALDAARLAFSRIGDAGRLGLFRLGLSEATGRPVFHLELPTHPNGEPLDDYTASLVVEDRLEARQETLEGAETVTVRLRGLGPHHVLHVTLVEDDGTSWTADVPADSTWSERQVPLSAFEAGRSVLLPEGFPGEWNYWVGPAEGRGGAGDHMKLEHVERLQLSLRAEAGAPVTPGSYGVEVEGITLRFGAPTEAAPPGR
ncbi:MAG TPA: hypothetical protein VEH83_03475 [Gemmatimonadales bacterium]|nr:hypothetical protein [Gemmatimonadales bacterium]